MGQTDLILYKIGFNEFLVASEPHMHTNEQEKRDHYRPGYVLGSLIEIVLSQRTDILYRLYRYIISKNFDQKLSME